jgi:hypothetical protein
MNTQSRTQLKAIKGYATEENVVFLTGDKVEVLGVEEGWIDLIGIDGWCNGIEMSFTPKIVAECFLVYYSSN